MFREVAVLDAIHRGGSYASRVRQLGPFIRARRRVSAAELAAWGTEVEDPLYSTAGDEDHGPARMAATVRHLQLACGGLLNLLCELQLRCGPCNHASNILYESNWQIVYICINIWN